MPSISQARLKELEAAVDEANNGRRQENERKEVAQRRVQTFDSILDKIVRAAQGRPLVEDRNAGYGYANMGMASDGHRCQPPTSEEALRGQLDMLNERIVTLESRLAAVVAVASFAREHKA